MKPPKERDECWKSIGVLGDATCPELQRIRHCYDCPVYSTAGYGLLEREPPKEYLDEWAHVLTQEKEVVAPDTRSILVFRLGREWFALPTQVMKEVTEVQVIHSVPQRSGATLMGLVNIRGEIQICVSISDVLGLERDDVLSQSVKNLSHQHMVVIERDGDCWVFPVDEISGISHFSSHELRDVPITVAKATATYTKGTISREDKSIGYLDDGLLFTALRRRIS